MKMDCFSKVSPWLIFALFIIRGGKAALLDTCVDDAACQVAEGDSNAVCSKDENAGEMTNGNCICTGSYKNNEDDDACVAKGNGDACSAESDCAAVTNSACESDMTCGCADGYKISLTTCSAVLETSCTGPTDCTDHVQNSECSAAGECSCTANYIQDGNVCAKVSVLETPCPDGNNDCIATNTECDSAETSPMCKCSNGYKQDSTDNTMCQAVLGTSCTGHTDCTDHVQNSECSAADECSCATNYIQDGNVCAKALGETCSAGECVTNAECDTTCKCSDGFIDTNGLCAAPSSAITTRLSASVAAMSILGIVIRTIF